MNTTNPTGTLNEPSTTDSVSNRVAEQLHERIDQAAKKGAQFERKLQERGTEAHDKAYELGNNFSDIARKNPLAVMGGSVALGILIGALASRN